MSFNKYFQDELTYLRELGAEFSHANPQLAPFLAERGSDPDVERLLEGFAFLSGRLSQRLNDQLPEMTHGMIEMMWPHYLRPLPSMSIVEFKPLPNSLTEVRRIKRGTEVDSIPIEGTACRYKTCYDVDVMPVTVSAASIKQDAKSSRLSLTFKTTPGVSFSVLNLSRIRFYLNADPVVSQTLYLWIRRYLKKIELVAPDNQNLERGIRLPDNSIQPVGFSADESLFDYSASVFSGYRLLQDYFVLQEKFMFIDLLNLSSLSEVNDEFTVNLSFERPLEEHIRVSPKMFRLHATPVANLFKRDGDPLRIDLTSMEYRVRPSGRISSHYEVYSIDSVQSRLQGATDKRIYSPLATFEHEQTDSEIVGFYHKKLKPSSTGKGFETYISLAGQKSRTDQLSKETISLELTCTNRQLPDKLKVGDIKVPTASSPEFVTFSNITAPTSSLYPSIEEGLQWQLISNMALNYSTLTDPEMLRVVLRAYDFRALNDRQAERQLELKLSGILDIQVDKSDRMVKGLPVRGLNIMVKLRESNFTSEGDMYLFASMLNQFFSLYASINSYHQLTVIGEEKGENYQWPLKMGQQNIL